MKEERDYIRDITEMRSMMERSSKFKWVSGWAGILAGIFSLAGAFIAYKFYDFNPGQVGNDNRGSEILPSDLRDLIFLAIMVFVLAACSAVFLSYRKAENSGLKLWNPTSKRLLINMLVPFIAGGILCIILILKGMIGFVAPFTLLFYGLALYNAGKYTYEEVRILGLIEIGLGLIGAYFVEYGLWIWALGFGVVHIIYGIYMHYRYER